MHCFLLLLSTRLAARKLRAVSDILSFCVHTFILSIRAYFYSGQEYSEHMQGEEIMVLTSPENDHAHTSSTCGDLVTKYFVATTLQDQLETQIDKTCFILSGHTLNMFPIAENCHIPPSIFKGTCQGSVYSCHKYPTSPYKKWQDGTCKSNAICTLPAWCCSSISSSPCQIIQPS
jgi:hypothetical protein